MAFKPNPDEIKSWCSRLERSEKKFELWREEGRKYNKMYDCVPGDIYTTEARDETQIVYRNGVFFNVSRDVQRMSVKDGVFQASPEISMISVDGPEGPVTVEGTEAAYVQSEILTYGFRKINFEETLPLVLEQAGIWNKGYAKLTTWNGAAASETEVWVSPEDGDDDKMAKRIRPRQPTNSMAGGRFPGIEWCDVEDVITDADALTKSQRSYICHRFSKPLKNMKSAECPDYDLEIGPEGTLVYKPKLDEAGEPVMVPMYENLEGLKGNLAFYIERRKKGMGSGDVRNEDFNTDEEVSEYIVVNEINGRFPANSEMVKKEFGGVPKTIDGYVYYFCNIVEQTDENSGGQDGPVCIRWKWYPVDIGGFAIKEITPMPKAASQKGFSRVRNYWEAMMWENYWDSYDQRYHEAMIPQTFADENVINAETVKKSRQQGGMWSWIFGKLAGNKSMRDAIHTTQFEERAPVIDSIKMRMRSIQDEGAGQSANQRLQTNSASATQSSIVQENAGDLAQFGIEIVKKFVEELAEGWMLLFAATLPPSGRFELPGYEGDFVQLDASMLRLACSYKLSYLSFPQSTNPVEVKQFQEFMMGVVQTPPNLWPMMRPLWKLQASKFSPAARSAYTDFEKEAFGKKSPADPDIIFQLLREGLEPPQIDESQDFVQNIPKLKDMLKRVDEDDQFAGWNQPLEGQHIPPKQQGKIPRTLLVRYIHRCEQIAVKKGLGPALGISGDKAGQSRKARGGGQAAGQFNQMANPSGAEISSSAESGAMPVGMGTGQGG